MSLPSFLSPSHFTETSFTNRQWRCTPDLATPYADIFNADYWAHVAAQMQPGDTVKVIAEDMSYYAELLVVDASRQWAKVKEIIKVELTAEEATPIGEEGDFEVKFRGVKRWSVIRKSTSSVEVENLATKADGYAWVANHQKHMAA